MTTDSKAGKTPTAVLRPGADRAPRPTAVLFDLGNTLAAYYQRGEFGPILERSVRAVLLELTQHGISAPDFDMAMAAAWEENREAPDFRFTPMEARLSRIFRLGASDAGLLRVLCERFLGPIFEVGRVYDDTLPVLEGLRGAGYATAIVSNAPWGSPPELWRNEIDRMGLARAAHRVILCGDVGWRKPAAQIFHHAAAAVEVPCERCVFVGDELQWDVAGSSAVGMQPVLIDRDDRNPGYAGPRVRNLHELLSHLGYAAT